MPESAHWNDACAGANYQLYNLSSSLFLSLLLLHATHAQGQLEPGARHLTATLKGRQITTGPAQQGAHQ